MKQSLLLAMVGLAEVAFAAADPSPAGLNDWFTFTLDDYSEKETVAGKSKGATNGHWIEAPATVTNEVQIIDNRKMIAIDTTAARSNLTFKADKCAWKTSSMALKFSARFTETDLPPVMDSAVKGALTLVQPKGETMPVFVGYTSQAEDNGWVRLYSAAATTPQFGTTYDYLVTFYRRQVSYYLRNAAGEYEPLTNSVGTVTFPAAGDNTAISRIEVEGKGAMAGFEADYRDAKITLHIK